MRNRYYKKLWSYRAEGDEGSGGGSDGPINDGGDGGNEGGDDLGDGASIEVSMGAPIPHKTVDFSTIVPESYKDKEYLKGIDSTEKLFEQFDNAQKLIGKKSIGVPDETASDEDWDKYYDSVRPKSAEDYTFTPPELGEEDKQIAEFFETSKNEDFDKKVKEIFREEGLTKRQADRLQQKYQKALIDANREKLTKAVEAHQQLNTDFNALAQETFGKRTDAVLKNSKALIEKYTPEKFKPLLDSMDNDGLVVLAGVLDGVTKDYIKEDGQTSKGSSSVMSRQEISGEGIKMMQDERYTNAFHPEHESFKKKVQEHYAKLDRK